MSWLPYPNNSMTEHQQNLKELTGANAYFRPTGKTPPAVHECSAKRVRWPVSPFGEIKGVYDSLSRPYQC
jgi:hypothetical protein